MMVKILNVRIGEKKRSKVIIELKNERKLV